MYSTGSFTLCRIDKKVGKKQNMQDSEVYISLQYLYKQSIVPFYMCSQANTQLTAVKVPRNNELAPYLSFSPIQS